MDYRGVQYVLILALISFLQCHGQAPHSTSYERKLRENFFTKRNRTATDIRPAANFSEPITVKLSLHLIHLTQLNVHDGSMSVLVFLYMSWKDASLTWNPSDYGGLDNLHIPIHLIWKPDLSLYNMRTEHDMTPMGNFKSIAYPDGTILWVPKYSINTICDTKISRFPYDEHECIMKFGSWTYDGYMIDLRLSNDDDPKKNIQMESMEDKSNEWELIRYEVERHEKYYSCCAEPYPDVTFTLILRRHSPYYTITMVIPSILFLFLILASFWLPPTAEEKVTLGCFNLLYVVILLGHLIWAAPRASLHVPNIVKFCSSLCIMAIISLVSNVITLAMSRRHQLSIPPRCCQLIFGCRLIRLCCLKVQNREDPHLLAPSNAEGNQEEAKASETPKLMDYTFIATAIDRTMFYVTVVLAISLLIYSFH